MSWTDERVAQLIELWTDGQSASQIAKALGGVTRNAVIGKVHRLGLSNRGSNTVSKAESTKKPPKAKPVKVEKPAPKPKLRPDTKAAEKAAPAPVPVRKKFVPANQPLPPQPSQDEISPEALETHREVQKNALRLSLMDLTERTCKWPFGDPAKGDFWFCGLPVEPGKPYCKPCADVAYQVGSSRKDRHRLKRKF